MSPEDRLLLIQQINNLLPQQLDMLILALNPPGTIVPPIDAPAGNRTTALLRWAETPTGCGLEQLQLILYKISPPTNNENRSKIPPDKLFDLLSGIDFKEQIKSARKEIHSRRTITFLVQGGSECGLDVLVTRLIRITKNWKKIKKKIIIQGNSRTKFVWMSLLRHLDRKYQNTQNLQQDTINILYELWKTDDVIIILRNVDRMGVKFLSDWLEEFWNALGTREAPEGNTKLLLFLLNNKEGEYPKNSQTPLVLLPPINYFTQDILVEWIESIRETRSDIEVPKELFEPTKLTLLIDDTCDGAPELVFDKICNYFGADEPEKIWKQCLI